MLQDIYVAIHNSGIKRAISWDPFPRPENIRRHDADHISFCPYELFVLPDPFQSFLIPPDLLVCHLVSYFSGKGQKGQISCVDKN